MIEFKDCQMWEGCWSRVYGYQKEGVYRVRVGNSMEFWVLKGGVFRNYGGFCQAAFDYFHLGRETAHERAMRLGMYA